MGRKRRKLAGAEKAIKEKESKMRQVKKLQNQQTKMAAKKQQKDQVKKIERSRRRKAINQAGGELSSADAPRLQCLDLPRVHSLIIGDINFLETECCRRVF